MPYKTIECICGQQFVAEEEVNESDAATAYYDHTTQCATLKEKNAEVPQPAEG